MTRTGESSRSARRQRALWTLAVFLSSIVVLFSLKATYRRHAESGLYFHPWTSDHMMQVVSVIDLRDEPLASLFYLHIQPPLFDATRALLSQIHKHEDYPAVLHAVDRDLLWLWAIAYGLLVGVVFLWLSRRTSPRFAAAGAVLCLLHPAFIFYGTYLDSTIVGALIMTWLLFEVWTIRRDQGSVARLTIAVVLLFLSRSMFQLPFLAVVLAAAALRGWSRRRLLVCAGLAGLLMSLYIFKQHRIFGTQMTSTFAGYNGCRSIEAPCDWSLRDRAHRLPRLPDPSRARALRRVRKPNGEYNFNQIAYLRISFAQMDQYLHHLRTTKLVDILRCYGRNLGLYLEPSSQYDRAVETQHALVQRLPWRKPYEWLFSDTRLAILVLGALCYQSIAFHRDRRLRDLLGLALPAFYVFAVSIVFEGGENMRFKFFLEPAACVLLTVTAFDVVRRFKRRAAVPSPSPRTLRAEEPS